MAATPILATDGQRRLESLAREILRTDEMLDEIAGVEALYSRDPLGATATGAATIPRAAHSIAVASILYALSEDPIDPVLLWGVTAPHRFHGLELPRSGFGIENPDNVYRKATVSGDHRYEIRGSFGPERVVELHFETRDSVPGMTVMAAEGGLQQATLRSDAIVTDADGNFTITIDASESAEATNHLTIPAGRTSFLIVRDLLGDWESELPSRLEIVRLDATEETGQADVPRLAKRSAEILRTIAPFWLDYFNQYSYGARPRNTVPAPRVRPGNRGMSTGGHFALEDDEALVVTLDGLGAEYLGIQLADPWGVAYEYVHRTSSLNTTQAHPNADGTYTFVISRDDPGVYNWLDTDGHSAGLVAVRWQSAADPRPDAAVRESVVVRFADLAGHLPEETLRVSAVERDLQRASRAGQFHRRYT
ncbi:DUF1214 domain-containing protein [Prescottella sp. R16]|uniref:DUF1214 domain-containing protein n=1 Tax=Prescottella sp. R16 TaxID=3064529 RepID=UPI00272EE2BD|nr:DUF1214 domain-containing protein [Prescottella sp. R16]